MLWEKLQSGSIQFEFQDSFQFMSIQFKSVSNPVQSDSTQSSSKWGWAICIGIHRISAMGWEFETPGNPNFLVIPLNIGFFRLKTPGTFRDFLGDHFATVESSGDQNLTMLILDFHVFPFLTPQKSHENPRLHLPLQNLVPWDHAQMIERKNLCRIALTRALYDQIRP